MKKNNIVEILQPVSKVCQNQESPKYPPAGNTFIKSISDLVITPFSAITVDGYIVNNHGKVTRLFFKREYRLLDVDATPLDIANALTEGINDLNCKVSLIQLASRFDCGVDFLLSPEGYPYDETIPDRMLLISLEAGEAKAANRTFIDYAQLADHIRFYRGKAFEKSKKMTVATSSIECYLANDHVSGGGTDPFPGDIVLIIFNNDLVYLVVEFKTHNLTNDINEQDYLKYPKEDTRRLQVLLNLTSALNCRLCYLFWGPNHQVVKIQEIDTQGQLIKELILKKGLYAF